jgi:tRNA dimethylallyltransferase
LNEILNEYSKNRVLILTGPTASGKTALGIRIAKALDGEIISADSMQIYKGLDITTAKPEKHELEAIPHHLIGVIEPSESFSVAAYVKLAQHAVRDVLSRKKIPIIVGGTGLYISALRDGINFDENASDKCVRERLETEAKTLGNNALWKRFNNLDPDSAAKIPPQNIIRVVRALEIMEITGEMFSVYRKNSVKGNPEFSFKGCYLEFENRSTLYARINERVDKMLDNGMLDECRAAFESGFYENSTVSQAIGYKELIPYFNGETNLTEASEKIKQSTRRYAKRQLTWFRNDEKLTRIAVSDLESTDIVYEKLYEFFTSL